MKSIKKSISLVVLPMIMTISGNSTQLKRVGWNLISVCQDFNRDQIDMTNIEEIQNQDGKSIYTGDYAFASNLNKLEAGYGYWVKTKEQNVDFNSGEARLELVKPLRRNGWNLMAVCENIDKNDINISNIKEIQNQDGKSLYTGKFASASNLDILEAGYGHWVLANKGTHFIAKRGLSIPTGFTYQTINNNNEIVETTYKEYSVKVYANYAEVANDKKNHVGIVIQIGKDTLPVLQIQDSYRGKELVVAFFDANGDLVAVSNNTVVSTSDPVTKITLNFENSTIPPITSKSTILGSIIKGPIDNATITLYDDNHNSILNTISHKGKFKLNDVTDLNSSYYTLVSRGGVYTDESTEQNVSIAPTTGLTTLFTKNELKNLITKKEFVAITPETTIYTTLTLEYLKTNNLEEAMHKAQETIYNIMIKDTSPFTMLKGDKFLKVGDFTLKTPKNQTEAFARNRAISFSNLMKNYNLDPERVFEIITKLANDYKDGQADGIIIDNEDLNITEGYKQARKDLFNTTTGGGNGGNFGNGGNNGDNNTTNHDLNTTTFSKALAIPKLAPYKMVAGYKVFNLDINESTTEFFSGIQTKTLGINSNILGQTIRIHNGDDVKLVYHNNLDEPTTIHGHGMHVPAIMDGGPINKIQPHTSWTAQYTVDQTACTNWYHPHLMGKTAEHVYHGLAGLIIIDDDTSDSLNLPKTYGVDDIPVVLQDKFFDADGQIDYSPSRMQIMRGYTGGYMLANGVINPYVNVPAKKVRFRLLNGSNSSLYKLEFKNKHEFYQIATDNSFLEKPAKMTQLVLTPGERGEIVVDFSNDLNKDFIIKDLTLNKEIMKINVTTASSKANQPLPNVLMIQEKLDPANAVRTRKFVLGMSQGKLTINGKSMDINRIDEFVPENDIEIWEITNMMGMEHNFHIHATHFLPLERNGSPANLTPAEHAYKDVIRLAGRDTVKVIVKMTDFVDDTTGYMYHCHFLEHEDNGMMGQFAITNGDAVINVGGSNSGGMGNGGNNMNGDNNQSGTQGGNNMNGGNNQNGNQGGNNMNGGNNQNGNQGGNNMNGGNNQNGRGNRMNQ